MNIKYLLGATCCIPLLPLMYYAGKRVRREVPSLDEATDTRGTVGNGPDYNLLLIGESTIAGVGVSSHKDGLTGSLADHISSDLAVKVNWEVKARSGYTAAKVNNKIVTKIEMNNPNLIIIGLGANDAFTLNTPRQWCEHISALIKKLQYRYPDAPIVFLNMPPLKAFPALPSLLKNTVGNLIEILGQELDQLIKKTFINVYFNSELIEFKSWGQRYNLSEKKEQYFSDGIHPSQLTYELWGKETFAFVKRNNLLTT